MFMVFRFLFAATFLFIGITFADDAFRRFRLDELAATRDEKEYLIANTPTFLLIQGLEFVLVWGVSLLCNIPVTDGPLAFVGSLLVIGILSISDEWRENQDLQALIKIRSRVEEKSLSKNEPSDNEK